MSPLEPVMGGRNLLVDEVYRAIRDAIQTMALPPGSALVESRLAASLQVSKTPVREALGRLAQEGLTEGAPFRGYRVTTFTSEDVRSIMDLRAVLEGLAARRACDAMPAAAVEDLAATTRLAEFQSSRGNWAAVSTLVHRVHALIHENCGDARLTSMIGVLNGQFERARLALPVGPDRLVRSVVEHAELLSAIQNRDHGLAERVMREHLLALIGLVGARDAGSEDAAGSGRIAPLAADARSDLAHSGVC